MVRQNTLGTLSFFRVAILVFDGVGATEEVTLLVILLQVLPELASFDLLNYFRSSHVELLRDTASKVNHSLAQLTTIQIFVTSVQFGVSFLHEWHPELIHLIATAIKRSLGCHIEWNTSINHDVLPSAVLEELEDSKTVLDTIVVKKVLKQFRVSALN